MISPAREKGDAAEQLALEYLSQRGLCLVQRNYSCRRGEIDLLMADRGLLGQTKQLVVVEVRYRNRDSFGSAAESVGHAKQRKLAATALHLMMEQPTLADVPWRFDVVAVSGDLRQPDIEWIPSAFEPLAG